MANPDNMPPMNRFVAYVNGVVLFLAFGLFSFLAVAIGSGPVNEVEEQRAAERLAALREASDATDEAINRSEVIDADSGRVRLPMHDFIGIAATHLIEEPMRQRQLTDDKFIVPGSETHQRASGPSEDEEHEDEEASEEEAEEA